MTSWQFLLAAAAVSAVGACGGDEGAAGDETTPAPGPAAPTSPAESSESPGDGEEASDAAASSAPSSDEPAYEILDEAPDGTPETFAELCAAQRQALRDGHDALTTLIDDPDDTAAREQLEASLRRTFELEPLTLELEPPSVEAGRVESEALSEVRDRFGAARQRLESDPEGLLLYQEIQQAASSED